MRPCAVERGRGFAHKRVMRILIPFASLVVLGACVAPSKPPPAPVAAPPPAAVPPVAPNPYVGDWRDWPMAAGTWAYAATSGGSQATFGSAPAAALAVRCDRAGQRVVLTRAGVQGTAVTIRTTSTVRALTGTATAAGVEVSLGARDPLLDAMGFSRGRFIVEAPPAAPLVVPAWPELLRVTEDCRR